MPKPLGPVQNGKQRFVVSFASPAEAEAIRGKPLTLTFVSDEGAREASVTGRVVLFNCNKLPWPMPL